MWENTIKIEITAETVAWYAAIVATISVVFSIGFGIAKLIKDKRKLRIKVTEGLFVLGRESDDRPKVVLHADNIGHSSVTVERAGFLLKGGFMIMILHPVNISFPYEVKGGKSCMVYFEMDELLKTVNKRKDKITYAFFLDAVGKMYKVKYLLKPQKTNEKS